MKTIVVSLVFVLVFIVPANAVNVEVGIYYGMSVVIPYGDKGIGIITSQIPSGSIDLGIGSTSFYTLFFLNQHFATGFELSMGTFSVYSNSSDSTIFSLGSYTYSGQVSYYLRKNSGNSPYLLGRISHAELSVSDSSFYQDDYDVISLCAGIGYQHNLKSKFLIRTELRYHRMFSTPKRDFSNAFSWVIGFSI